MSNQEIFSQQGGGLVPDITRPLTAAMGTKWNGNGDLESSLIPEVINPMVATAFGGDVARTLSARHDSSPCVDRGMDIVAFYPTNRQPEFGNYTDLSPSVKVGSSGSSGNPPAVAFERRMVRTTGGQPQEELSHCLRSDTNTGDGAPCVATAAAVRRLTPRECERLQGFPDDHTLIPWRGKTAPDGPRYKALGNSMAVPVMRWIGQRIAHLESTNPTPTTP
jgi:DNA (cytosine-5)-methyltransferase 1